MLNEFTKEKSWNRFTNQKEGQEAAALGQGTGMITRIRIIVGEAVVEAGEGIVRLAVAGIEIIVTEAEAAVGALITTKTVEGADMMMIDAAEVGLMEAPPLLSAVQVLEGANLPVGPPLLMVQVLMQLNRKIVRQPTKVCHHMVDVLIPEADLRALMLMIEWAGYHFMVLHSEAWCSAYLVETKILIFML